MKGYLNNIAAQGLGLTEVILPRLASRFEPLSLGREPVSRARDGNNGELSSSPLFDNLRTVAESTEFQTLSPQRAIGASRQKNSDIQFESNPIPSNLASQRTNEMASASIPEDCQLIHREIGQEQQPFSLTSFSIKQPKEADLSTEHADPMDSIEPPDFREFRSEESIRFKNSVKGASQPSKREAIKPATIEKVVSEPQSVVTRNGKRDQNKSIETEVKRPDVESPIHIIEIERISEAKSRMPVRYLSETDSTKITQPSIPRSIPSKNSPAKYFLQSESELIESKLLKKPEHTIHVTIGSIEVKATLPSAKTKSERRAPPVMGLKEYLQNRGGSK